MREETGLTGRPKSKGRHAFDAVLFAGVALAIAWAGFGRLDVGEINLRRGGVVRLAEDPVMFWLWLAGHLVVALACGWLAYRAARGFLRLQGSARP
ncbi:hypothetical protein [Brevundimonas lenta]|uniref:Uncharacterized protein n=1 Tax=Brevundimonas lenta TaxID=424796 RepID=A0A7W6JB90_9CAUL|nr:hypothetical protein [Brevundimonas lenta]MBB4081926.1 hypothetical protein [Brevundimonas lenta]